MHPIFVVASKLLPLQQVRSQLAAALKTIDELLASERATESKSAGPSAGNVRAAPRTTAIEWALAQSDRPLRPVEIWAALQAAGRTDPKMDVQVSTYDLWKRGRIDKVGRGLYQTLHSVARRRSRSTPGDSRA